jgi:hypothetical protein
MEIELVAALIGVAATLAAVVVGVILQQRSNRARLTFDMHAEFNNSEFTRARADAAAALRDNPGITFANLTDRLPDESRAVWLVVQFYQKLWVGIKYKHIDTEMVPDLFGSIFFYWYLVHFEEMLSPVDYPATENIKELKQWFDSFAQPSLWRWKERAAISKEEVARSRRLSD